MVRAREELDALQQTLDQDFGDRHTRYLVWEELGKFQDMLAKIDESGERLEDPEVFSFMFSGIVASLQLMQVPIASRIANLAQNCQLSESVVRDLFVAFGHLGKERELEGCLNLGQAPDHLLNPVDGARRTGSAAYVCGR